MAKQCSLCGATAAVVLHQRVLGKYDVPYFRCPDCDLIETENAYWLDEAYGTAIAQLDTGAIARNEFCADLTLTLSWLLGLPRSARFLDYGGGHGVLARMLRDRGLDFRWLDAYGQNLFVRGFEGDEHTRYDLVTAFEVFEHFADAGASLNTIFAPGPQFVLVGTVLHSGIQPGWWYLTPETGQHVAFFSARTMEHIAQRFGYETYVGANLTLFIGRAVSIPQWRRVLVEKILRSPGTAFLVAKLLGRAAQKGRGPYRSLTESDFLALRGRR